MYQVIKLKNYFF